MLHPVADLYPAATIAGIDLSAPTFAEGSPPNAYFILDDIEHEGGWDLQENFFDYIHVRNVMFSIRDKKLLIERAFR